MFSRTYLAISGAKVARAVCRPINAWAVNLFLPNLGFGRLVEEKSGAIAAANGANAEIYTCTFKSNTATGVLGRMVMAHINFLNFPLCPGAPTWNFRNQEL
jgi:hypothetical protein